MSCRTTAAIICMWLGLAGTPLAADALLSGEDPFLVSPEGRLAIGRADDYVPSAVPEVALKILLRDSMKARRDFAWSVVEQMLIPTILTSQDSNGNPTTIKVPRWQTWYEGRPLAPDPLAYDEVSPLLAAYIAKLSANPTSPIPALIDQVFDEFATKDLEPSLTNANFQKVLNQNLGTGDLPPNAELGGTGSTLFSPSFVRHVMLEARRIFECDPRNVPASQMPATPDNFTHCMGAEFPRSATMVKTEWRPLAEPLRVHDTTPAGVDAVLREGTWPGRNFPDLDGVPGPDKRPETIVATENQIYTNVSAEGTKFGLTGIHFVTKDVREWVWVSLWWDPNAKIEDFGTDQPQSIAGYNGGVWQNYKMCVNTSFAEGDPQPWQHYSGPQSPLANALQAAYNTIDDQAKNGSQATAAFAPTSPDFPTPFPDALMAAAPPHDVPTSWCSNPNIETHRGNGRTSCIGCHQFVYTMSERRTDSGGAPLFGSFAHVLVGDFPQFGRTQARNNFPGEFFWSFFMEFQPAIEDAINASPGFNWP
jgi:hypothetical protein